MKQLSYEERLKKIGLFLEKGQLKPYGAGICKPVSSREKRELLFAIFSMQETSNKWKPQAASSSQHPKKEETSLHGVDISCGTPCHWVLWAQFLHQKLYKMMRKIHKETPKEEHHCLLRKSLIHDLLGAGLAVSRHLSLLAFGGRTHTG